MNAPTTNATTGLPRTPPEVAPRARALMLGLLLLTGLCGAIGTALSPYLLVEHPLLLVGLNPDSRHLVLAAARADIWQVTLVAAPRRGLNFVATYAVGGLYGYALLAWMEKRGRIMRALVRWGERLYLRFGVWLVLLVPIYSVAGLAGVARMRFRSFALAIVPGQFAFVIATLYVGDAVRPWTEPFIAWIADHVVESTVACVVAVVLQRLWSRWRKQHAGPEQPEPDAAGQAP